MAEAHHAPAPTYRRILEYCRAWHPDGPLVVGVTATPERGDHHSLRLVFDGIVYQKTLLEMMQAGYLVDLRALQILLQADFDALRIQQGDFVEAELESLLLAANAPAQVLAAFQTHAAERKALLFTPTVALAYAMAVTPDGWPGSRCWRSLPCGKPSRRRRMPPAPARYAVRRWICSRAGHCAGCKRARGPGSCRWVRRMGRCGSGRMGQTPGRSSRC